MRRESDDFEVILKSENAGEQPDHILHLQNAPNERSRMQRIKDKIRRSYRRVKPKKSKKKQVEQELGGDEALSSSPRNSIGAAGFEPATDAKPAEIIEGPAAASATEGPLLNIKLGGRPEYVCDVERLDARDVQRLELLGQVGGLPTLPNRPNSQKPAKSKNSKRTSSRPSNTFSPGGGGVESSIGLKRQSS